MNKGFTLIEMIVAIAVFTVVMTITLATYLNVSDIQRKASALRSINDNLNFSLEVMSREIMENRNYACIPSSPCNSFSSTNSNGETIVYSLNNNSIERRVDAGILTLTSPDIKINSLVFKTYEGISEQPMVTIIISGSAGEKIKIETRLNVQTTISQRKL